MKRSIGARLVLMFALGAAITFTLIGVALWAVLAREIRHYEDSALETHLQNMRYSIERFGDSERWQRLAAKMDTLSPADGSVRFWVASADPRFRYGQGVGQTDGVALDDRGRGTLSPGPDGRDYRVLAQRIPAFEDRPAVRLMVGIATAPFERTMHVFLAAMALVSLCAVGLVTGLGAWISRIGLTPLQQLSSEARALRPKARSQRLNVADLPVELEDLAVAFNGALERLEAAYRQLEAFNADVAHELRTPLTNMIGGTQVALARKRSGSELQETLQSNLEELERVRSIVNDMLFLARADQGEAATGLAEAGVVDEVRMTLDFFEPLIDETGMTVAVEGELGVRATMNVPLFRRALSNLLQNAIDHSAPAARLVVTISRQAEAVWVGVSNPGPAIDANQLPRLFDRFYRVDTARHDASGLHGHGLGLAIVKAVAGMHGGAVAAQSAEGVTTVSFSLPSA